MKFVDFIKEKKNRYIIIGINVIISIVLAFLSVALDEKYGESAVTSIYIMQIISIVCFSIIFALIIFNIWLKAKKKLQKRDQEKGLDK